MYLFDTLEGLFWFPLADLISEHGKYHVIYPYIYLYTSIQALTKKCVTISNI